MLVCEIQLEIFSFKKKSREVQKERNLHVKASNTLKTKGEGSHALLVLNLAMTLEPLHRGKVP